MPGRKNRKDILFAAPAFAVFADKYLGLLRQ